MSPTLLIALAVLAVVSFLLSPKVRHADGFFKGHAEDGGQPSLLTLTFSQVTTWIFARSLLTAAILGYYYGIAGGLAYAAYYFSFFTGGAIVDSLRFRHGFDNVQGFLTDRFGRTGPLLYNFVIALRLLSEVFANLLVIGIIFGDAGSSGYTLSIIALAVVVLAYSMMGGLRASLRTDVFQMSLFLALLIYLVIALLGLDTWSASAVLASSPDITGPGWVLLAVALLQVWSYPLHDPVMMDRGFVADRKTTRQSFIYAGVLSIICILAFALLGMHAGLHALEGEKMLATLERMLGPTTMMVLQLSLIVSAVSTMDSTFSSAAKLAAVDMRIVKPTIGNGRIAMAAFMIGGLGLVFVGSKDLFDAVAVSGTASMFLAPVIFFSIWGGVRVPTWTYVVSFAAAMAGAALYFVEAGGTVSLMTPLLGLEHKYAKLLVISGGILVIGCGSMALSMVLSPMRKVGNEAG